jgi:hypothetical protein
MDSSSFLVAFPTALKVIRMVPIRDEFLAKIADPMLASWTCNGATIYEFTMMSE